MRITSPLSSLSRRKRNSNLEEINSILDLFPVAALYVDGENQRIVLANTRASELSAYTREELVNLSLEELFIHLDLTPVLQGNQHEQNPSHQTLVKRNSSLVEVLAYIQKVSTPENWLLISLQPASDFHNRQAEGQRFKLLLEELRSLTTATQTEELYSALELVFETGYGLIAAPSMAIYLADSQKLKLNCIAARSDLFPEQLPSKDLIQLHNPQVWEPGVRPQSTLHSLARANGLAYLASAPIGDPNASIGLFVAADHHSPPSEDILPIIQILASVLQNIIQYFYQIDHLKSELDTQLRFRRFTETAQSVIQDVLIVSTADFRVVTINRSAELALGYNEQEAKSMPLKDILVGPETLQTALEMAQEGIPTLNQDKIRLYRRSGEAFLARVSTLPVRYRDQVEGLIILIQDLTEQENAKTHAEQLKQQALLGTVTAIFAHEVRNPINSISTGLQLMAYNLQPDDPQQELITRMQQDCVRLEEMMKSVLAFSRSTEYELEPVDLGLLVSRMLDRMRPRMSAVNVTHRVNVEHNAPLVLGNPRALEQVFNNLFSNAIQAMEEKGGMLAVKVQLSKNTGKRKHAQVIVADSGPGIPKEIQDKIFNPFFTTKSTGTGLGLAISQRIVTAHKGIIQLSSFPGGTVFTVKIPAMQQELDGP
jgi:two-component system sensor histidine kinase AtoS